MKTSHTVKLVAAALIGVAVLTTTLRAQDGVTNSVTITEVSTSTAAGSPAAKPAAPWQFDFSIIGWGPAVNGDVTVRGHKAKVDESLSDLLDDLKGIAMFGLGLRKEKFGFYAQPNWIKLEENAKVGPLKSTLEQKLWIVDGAGFYQLHKWGEEKPVTLDALAGVRYWNFDNELTVKGTDGIVNFNGSHSTYLIDPIVGLRTKIYLTKKFNLDLHGDVGGFGISDHSSDFSWQAVGLLGYDFTRHFSASLGYRALSVDKDFGKGSNKNSMDVILHGFLLGLNFHL
jgi:hypothetical protein